MRQAIVNDAGKTEDKDRDLMHGHGRTLGIADDEDLNRDDWDPAMKDGFEGRWSLSQGAASRIGEAIARCFTAESGMVVLLARQQRRSKGWLASFRPNVRPGWTFRRFMRVLPLPTSAGWQEKKLPFGALTIRHS
ncbi:MULTISPECIES: hypothetical protein [unclassified Bradyrhizobium]|uniref:hypothetical protein n=1 Tax=unclassified Bradyrhizobium TaxID=2631580 RepID=UPI00247A6A3C|nr:MULTISPECIES: hypothetical protein [unclassified Bradyrhizobium]WGS19910.1 hypothetical protein MTX22_37285 [Bradyrhizobium sp. ISRA463]WGS26763.1 hypothetical protein MTX19_34735 [Bradyrhizobium sp. ISRA464]